MYNCNTKSDGRGSNLILNVQCRIEEQVCEAAVGRLGTTGISQIITYMMLP